MADEELPRLLVSDRQSLQFDLVPLLQVARATLIAEGATDSELSVSFVDAKEMTALHERWMDEGGPTDVLSFAMDEAAQDGVRILGDVVICPEVAADAKNALPDELRLLLVHGTLHLLGYDHEDDAERAQMWAKQEAHSGVRVAP
ncbi:MAG: rRNA maturation RNase YbeY [Actinobacteria bacterium]|nr:rRNA maturation RNase YbeY [Actinomycetota bacterium]